jgi:exodeoxyribonuclease V alpha subunit
MLKLVKTSFVVSAISIAFSGFVYADINADLQNILNQENSGTSLMHFNREFRLGDRVMQLKNNYDNNIFNGDMGRVIDIIVEKKRLIVDFAGKNHPYEFSELNDLSLSYAISIHKSQGSEFDAVIIPLFMQHFMMLQKKIIYTAITRAKKLCIIAGQKKSLAMGIKNDKEAERITFLQEFLRAKKT